MHQQAVVTDPRQPKTGHLQQIWRWFYLIFIVIVVNVLLVVLLLQFIIIPYLIKATNLPNNTSLNLYMKLMGIFSPNSISTPSSLPQDAQYPRHTVVYL
jgi:hypothetical protein